MDATILDVFYNSLEQNDFQVFYQPKVSLKDYTLTGAEALCRWSMNGFLIMPDDFVPALEKGNEICALDFYILEHVCRDIRKWIDMGLNTVKISVNLSRRHLSDPDLVDQLLQIIDKYEVPHKFIEIELTETTTDVDFSDLKRVVTALHQQGIHTSVDDFGIGYSSMNLIRELPWDVLKLDKSFLPSRENSNKNQYILLKAVISMAQDMGMECLAEGVETVEHVKLLKECNCFLAQGFYFDRALPSKEFEKRLMF